MGIFDTITNRVEGILDEVFIPEDVRRLLQRAARLIERGSFDQALDYLERAEAKHPDFHRTRHLMGRCHFGMGRFEAALEAFEDALAEREEAFGHFYAGLAAEQIGRHRRARDHFHAALASADQLDYEYDVHFALGRVYRQMGRLDRAIRSLEKARQIAVHAQERPADESRFPDGRDVESALNDVSIALAGALVDGRQVDRAAEILDATEIPEQNREALLVRARVNEATGHPGRAAEQYRRALEAVPGDLEAMLGAARAHLAVNATAQAQELLLRALEAVEGADSDKHDGGGEDDEPVPEYRRAEILTLLGRANERAANHRRALDYYERALEALPAGEAADGADGNLGGRAQIGAGRMALELELWDKAARRFETAAATASGNLRREALVGLARSRLETGELAAARRLLAEAADVLDGDAEDAEIRYLRGRAALAGGDAAEALIAFEDAHHLAERPALRQTIEARREAALQQLEPDWQLPETLDGPLAAERTLQQLADVLRETPRLRSYLQEVRDLEATLSEPLSIAVLGEFNAGKSTLVNALVGEEVAPTGVLPTTAHTCFVRYAPRKTARVVYKKFVARASRSWATTGAQTGDGLATNASQQSRKTLEVNYDEARRRMKEEPDAIDHLEFLYPHPQLRAVEFCDTPGFNALDENHEAIARETLQQAEAILWVLDANQALSQTEFELLESIPDSRERVVVLLNKVDRLGTGEERERAAEELVDYVEEHIGSRIAGCFAISAREAMQARAPASADEAKQTTTPEAFDDFEAMLDSRIIQRAGRIKTLEVRRELGAIVERLESEIDRWLDEHASRVERADALIDWVAEMAETRPEAAAERQADTVADQFSFVARTIAREVRDSLRPSGAIFSLSRMKLAEDDREFIVELFADRLVEVLERSHREVRSEVEELETDIARRVGDLLDGLSLAESRALDRRLEGLFDETRVLKLLLEERVYGELEARAGGRIEAAAPSALEALQSQSDAPLDEWQAVLEDLLPEADSHIDASLGDWYREFFMAVRRFCERARRDLQLVGLEIEHRLELTPLTDLLGSS